jgi:hypothetical protein
MTDTLPFTFAEEAPTRQDMINALSDFLQSQKAIVWTQHQSGSVEYSHHGLTRQQATDLLRELADYVDETVDKRTVPIPLEEMDIILEAMAASAQMNEQAATLWGRLRDRVTRMRFTGH